jgi:hypothetical protein
MISLAFDECPVISLAFDARLAFDETKFVPAVGWQAQEPKP